MWPYKSHIKQFCEYLDAHGASGLISPLVASLPGLMEVTPSWVNNAVQHEFAIVAILSCICIPDLLASALPRPSQPLR